LQLLRVRLKVLPSASILGLACICSSLLGEQAYAAGAVVPFFGVEGWRPGGHAGGGSAKMASHSKRSAILDAMARPSITDHRHSGIGFMASEAMHYATAAALHLARTHSLEAALNVNPLRFKGVRPTPPARPTAAWINLPPKETKVAQQITDFPGWSCRSRPAESAFARSLQPNRRPMHLSI
jgi:hypothetical protein